MFYSAEQVADLSNYRFEFLKVDFSANVLRLTLNRPEKKNAMNPTLLNELAFALTHAKYNNSVWAVVIGAEGNIFCAGADLLSFAGAATEQSSTIPDPSEPIRLVEVFNSLYKPCIARVHGSVYAGGFMIVSGCTHVISLEQATFSLPEVKRGLWPFQVMAGLMNVMPHRTMLDLCMRAGTLTAQQAKEAGLVSQIVANVEELDSTVNALVDDIKQYSPAAIRKGLEAYHNMSAKQGSDLHLYMFEMLGKTIETKDAQEGLKAFMEKRQPVWTGE